MRVVVLDTTVAVSAGINPIGPPGRIVPGPQTQYRRAALEFRFSRYDGQTFWLHLHLDGEGPDKGEE